MLGKLKLTAITSIISIIAASAAMSGEYVEGKVLSVEPNYYSFVEHSPRKVCHNVTVPQYHTNQGNVLQNMIIGGLIGGTSTNSDRGAAAGAVIGGLLSQNNNTVTGFTTRQRCSTQYTERVINKLNGYNVSVQVGNDIINLTMNTRPGNTIMLYTETTYRID